MSCSAVGRGTDNKRSNSSGEFVSSTHSSRATWYSSMTVLTYRFTPLRRICSDSRFAGYLFNAESKRAMAKRTMYLVVLGGGYPPFFSKASAISELYLSASLLSLGNCSAVTFALGSRAWSCLRTAATTGQGCLVSVCAGLVADSAYVVKRGGRSYLKRPTPYPPAANSTVS
jgi:hypothetical protein